MTDPQILKVCVQVAKILLTLQQGIYRACIISQNFKAFGKTRSIAALQILSKPSTAD